MASKNNQYLKYNRDRNTTWILKHKNITYYYNDQIIKTNKKFFISFVNKTIQHDQTFKNDKIQLIYNRIITYFVEIENWIKTCTFVNKKENNIKMDSIWKLSPLEKGYRLVNAKRNKTNFLIIRTTKMHLLNPYMSDLNPYFNHNA